MDSLKVAVTGGIGSGKSYVCRLLEKRGLTVYDCDRAAKRLMASSEMIRSSLKDLIGEDVYDGDTLRKSVIAEYLLKSEDNAKRLNGIIHPAVAEDFRQSRLQWMECAILFSSGFDKLVDRVVCVTAPLDVRIGRIMQRDGISREKAIEWIGRQMPQDEVIRRSNYVIVNDGIQNLDKQISKVLTSLNYR